MYGCGYIPEQDKLKTQEKSLTDLNPQVTIYYVGDEPSGIIDVAASTSDVTFKHGAVGAEAVDDDTVLDAGGVGLVDLSADVTSWANFVNRVNASTNWRASWNGALPGDAPNSGATGYLIAVTGAQCKSATGYSLLLDTSVALHANLGLTYQGHPSAIHPTDSNVVHEVLRAQAQCTYTGAATWTLYEVDDILQTSRAIYTLTPAATTVLGSDPDATVALGEPIVAVNSRRLVAKFTAATTLTAADLRLHRRSWAYGVGIRRERTWARLSAQPS